MSNERNANGKFAKGNTAAAGHGRPARATERAYLLALSDMVTLEDWRAVCRRALEDAKAGDKSARDWLARYLLGVAPSTLLEVAADELAGVTPELEVDARLEYERQRQAAGSLGASLLELSGGARGVLMSMANSDGA